MSLERDELFEAALSALRLGGVPTLDALLIERIPKDAGFPSVYPVRFHTMRREVMTAYVGKEIEDRLGRYVGRRNDEITRLEMINVAKGVVVGFRRAGYDVELGDFLKINWDPPDNSG